MSKLASMVAIVTGSAAGIGRASAVRLAKEGASVVVADINPEGSAETVGMIESAGGTGISVPTDIGEPDQILALIEGTVEHFGTLDILHNNAADTSSQGVGRDKDLLTITSDLWDRTLAVNLRGPMLACRAAIPVMRRGGGGSIINTTSVSGMTGDLIYTAYGVSKAGLIVLTKYIATQYGKDGIRCNSISPESSSPRTHPIGGPGTPRTWPSTRPTSWWDLGVPDDIAGVVAFLASSDARYITGENIRVDGGMQSHIATLGHLEQSSNPRSQPAIYPFDPRRARRGGVSKVLPATTGGTDGFQHRGGVQAADRGRVGDAGLTTTTLLTPTPPKWSVGRRRLQPNRRTTRRRRRKWRCGRGGPRRWRSAARCWPRPPISSRRGCHRWPPWSKPRRARRSTSPRPCSCR